METEIYTWVGKITVWLFVAYIIFKILSFILIEVINWLGNKFDTTWSFIEYLVYKKDFKKWVKNKRRIKKQ